MRNAADFAGSPQCHIIVTCGRCCNFIGKSERQNAIGKRFIGAAIYLFFAFMWSGQSWIGVRMNCLGSVVEYCLVMADFVSAFPQVWLNVSIYGGVPRGWGRGCVMVYGEAV